MADVIAVPVPMRGELQSRRLDLHQLAEHQHGRVARRQLRDVGFSDAAIDRLIAARTLVVVHRGVYAIGHVSRTAEGNWMGAVLAGGPEARLGYRAAAAAWDLRPTASGLIEVSVPRSGRRHIPGVRVHTCRPFHPEDVDEINNIPVTSVARTILDCAEVLTVPQIVRMPSRLSESGSTTWAR